MIRSFLAAALLLPLAASAQTDRTYSPFGLPDTPISPESIAMGGASVAVATNDPLALFVNPAMLAAAGRRPSFRIASSLTPELYGSNTLLAGSGAATVGLRASLAGRPLYIGLGGGYSEINLDAQAEVVDPSFYQTEERAYGGGLGLSWDAGPAIVRVGAAAFGREAFEARQVSGSLVRDRAVTLDLGTAVTVPLLRGPNGDGETAPSVSVTAAYTARDLTLSTDYFEREVSPFPGVDPGEPEVTHRTGLSASGALVRQLGARGRFHIAEATVSGESRSGGSFDESTRFGGAVTLAETLILRAGRTSYDRGDDWTSYGASLSLDGLVRAIGAASQSPELFALSDRLTMRVDLARLDAGGDVQTEYAGFTLGWRP